MILLLTLFLVKTVSVNLVAACSGISSSGSVNNMFSSSTGFFKQPTPSSVVPLTIIQDAVIGRISVGKTAPGGKDQVFDISMKTRAAESWLLSADLCKNKDCSKEPFNGFDGSKSESYEIPGFKFVQTDWSALGGQPARDQFKFGVGKNAAVVTIEFIDVNHFPFEYTVFDGTLGLSLRHPEYIVSEASYQAFHQQLKEAVFGFYFHKTKKNNDGYFIVGGKDADFMTGRINSHKVLEMKGVTYGWHILIDKIVLIFRDGTRKEQTELSMKVAAPAPDGSDIYLPLADVDALKNQMFENANIATLPNSPRVFRCNSNLQDLPTVAIVIDGIEYTLTPEEYVRPTSANTGCVVAFGNNENEILLGQVFMKKYYTRFHVQKKEVQFALAKNHP